MILTLTNAAIVLPDQVVHGSLSVQDGIIADVQPGPATGHDLDGDYLIPGVIDLHTDNLERQVEPRRNARWPSRAALLAHDSHCAAAGITTVFDAMCVGHAGMGDDRPRTCMDGVADLDALAPTGLLKADHFLHLRCELPAPGMLAQLDTLAHHPLLRLVSLMDHTPGARQFSDLTRYRALLRQDGMPADAVDTRIDALLAQQAEWSAPNRAALLARGWGGPVVLASHDDATAANVDAAVAGGITISEFPVNLETAARARACSLKVVAGAPNLVRGGSHGGNVAAAALLQAGLLDALASDYVPASLVHAAFIGAGMDGLGLPGAVALVTSAPARLAGLADRGVLVPGLRADLVRVRVHQGMPVVREVWRAGERVI